MKGYKVATKKDGKYYSFFTGIEYKNDTEIHPVSFTEWVNVLSDYDVVVEYFNSNILSKDHRIFNKDHTGRTQVFLNKKHAKNLCKSVSFSTTLHNIVILKVKFDERKSIFLNYKPAGSFSSNNVDTYLVSTFKIIKEVTC